MDNSTVFHIANGTGGSFSADMFTIGAMCTFGMIGNIVVLVIFIISKKLRTPQDLFIMTLAVADILELS